jgi:hypothetical protein
MDKIPYVACLLHSFLSEDISDAEMVRIFLELKNSITNEMGGSLAPVKSSGVEYVFFLAAFNSIRGHSLHSPTSQLTIFHLSECLTVINSYKSSTQRKLLLVSKDATKNASTSIVSTLDLPALQVASIFHILHGIIDAKVTLDLSILSDVLGSALRMFLRIIVHPHCPSNLRKAYVHLVVKLLDKKSIVYGHIENTALETDLLGSLTMFLKKFHGDLLRDVLIQVTPLLGSYIQLSTPFVAALLKLDDKVKNELLSGGQKYHKVSWDAPFLFDVDHENMTSAWYTFGIAMGLFNMIKASTSPIDMNSLHLLLVLLQTELRKEEGIDERMSKKAVDNLFSRFSDFIIAALAVPDTSSASWEAFSMFMNLCSYEVIAKVRFFD